MNQDNAVKIDTSMKRRNTAFIQRPSPLHVNLAYLIQQQRPASTLNLRASHPRSLMSGAHLSRLHGRGVEFDEVRPYQAGDDVRNIDWRVTARTGKPHIKVFREERERPVFLLVDFRPAMFFATQGALKSVVASECASLMAWAVLQQGDRLGCLLMNGAETQNQTVMKPARGRRAVLRCLGQMKEVTAPVFQGDKAVPLMDALRQSANVSRTGSMLVVVSDARGLDDDAEALLRSLLHHHDIIFIWVFDPFEIDMPKVGILPVFDGQVRRSVNTQDRRVRAKHRALFEQRRETLRSLQSVSGFSLVECQTTDVPVHALQEILGK